MLPGCKHIHSFTVLRMGSPKIAFEHSTSFSAFIGAVHVLPFPYITVSVQLHIWCSSAHLNDPRIFSKGPNLRDPNYDKS